MTKRKYIDFSIYDRDNEKVIFRFYPEESNCHSFGDEPPKSWDEVYKVYYSYAILQKFKNDPSPRTLFKEHCDECSVIDEVAARIKLIVKGQEIFHGKSPNGEEYEIPLLNKEVFPMGQGVGWVINKISEDTFGIQMWNWNDTGYRFYLKKDKLKEFGEFLEECCEHMLENGDPI